MADNNLIMTLGKVIIAAAWADGEISNDEINALKDLIFRLPDVSAHQWDELDIYIDSPVGPDERAQLVAQLQSLTQSPDQRQLALDTLNSMVNADGAVTDGERAIVAEVQQSLSSGGSNGGVWGSFSRALIGRRSQAVVAAPNREAYLDVFIRNRVYYKAKQRLQQESLNMSDADLWRLSLAGALMALVAEVSEDISPDEHAAMVDALQTRFGLGTDQATFVVEVATSPEVGELDFYRTVREFSDAFSLEERQRFLETLFAVAASDGQASFEEIEQIRLIAQGFKLTHEEFIQAKLTVSRSARAE